MKSQREETSIFKRRLFVGIKASYRGLSLGEFLCMTHCDVAGLSSWPSSGSTSSKVPSSPVRGSIMASASNRLHQTSAGRLRVGSRVSGSIKVNLRGVFVLLKSSFSQKVPDSYIPKPPVAGCGKLCWHVSFRHFLYLNNAIEL